MRSFVRRLLAVVSLALLVLGSLDLGLIDGGLIELEHLEALAAPPLVAPLHGLRHALPQTWTAALRPALAPAREPLPPPEPPASNATASDENEIEEEEVEGALGAHLRVPVTESPVAKWGARPTPRPPPLTEPHLSIDTEPETPPPRA